MQLTEKMSILRSALEKARDVGEKVEAAKIAAELGRLDALFKMDNAPDQGAFNTALLDYLFSKEGVE